MTKERLQAVLLVYGDKLRTLGYKSERFSGAQAPDATEQEVLLTRFEHLAWMCDETLKFTVEDEMEKAMRWLGFIQGAFWVLGFRTIDAMREDNRMPSPGEPPKPRACFACRIEAEIGTEEDPHPVPERFHSCVAISKEAS